jgi:hypothetical protein
MSKIDFFLFMHFFIGNFSLFKLSHIPFDRASLALQNCIYDIFSGPQYITEKVKILLFFTKKFPIFFSILTKSLGQTSVPKKYFVSFCSPSNSASNHRLDSVSKLSGAEIIRSNYRSLTPYFAYFNNNTIFIFVKFLS